jgi:hypothetical protein
MVRDRQLMSCISIAVYVCIISKDKSAVLGRAVAQAVNRWFPTAAARVRARADRVGFVVDKVALGQDFSEYFGFPCQSSYHQFLPRHNQPGLAQ